MGGLAPTLSAKGPSDPSESHPGRRLTVAIVLPVLNEEQTLAGTLGSLLSQTVAPDRIVVSDGGSTDGTAAIAEKLGAHWVRAAAAGRGNQIAAGLEHCDEDVVVVAHADMHFPSDALERMQRALAESQDAPGGCFGHRFDASTLGLKIVERWDRFRARRLGVSYGDQGQFFRRQPLLQSGGFPPLPLMEDVELSRKLKSLGRPVYLDCPVTVSSRRFEKRGLIRCSLMNFGLRLAYRLFGTAGCQRLYRWYY